MRQYIRPLLPLTLIVSATMAVVPVNAQESAISESTTNSEVISSTTEVNSDELTQDNSSDNSQSVVDGEESTNKNGNITAQKPENPPKSDRIPVFSRIFPFAPLMRQ